MLNFGIKSAPLFDELLKGLLDNQHVKLRTQISDALLAFGAADPFIHTKAESSLRQLLDRLKFEREGASFKQVVAIDQLLTKVIQPVHLCLNLTSKIKVEVLLARVLDPAQVVGVSGETG